jgi:predicted Zn-dependent protease
MSLEETFRQAAPAVDFCSLRRVTRRSEGLQVRRGHLLPARSSDDVGAMLTVHDGGGIGYAATSDLSRQGIEEAARRACDWARRSAGSSVMDFRTLPRELESGAYQSPVERPWADTPLGERIDIVRSQAERLRTGPEIVDWGAALYHEDEETLLLTADGVRIEQRFSVLVPGLSATANRGTETHTRSLAGGALCRQGGLEVLDAIRFHEAAPRIGEQACELLDAPNCPEGTLDLVLAPDQMYIQIHESIGHPIELDRILGDERNYAGTSFVTLDMFGSYRYGSELLNISFDPARQGQLASYAFDDDGRPAERQLLIRDGVLLRPLGGAISQARAGIDGVANSRATSWNRPPIDRMANLNLEPGDATLEELIGGVERGVYMEANRSWSIDDSRNKFQFGCEWGRRIQNGELREVVRNPNYRGVSATFWRSLAGVGNAETVQVMGTPNCGKGEPNQAVRVGHASPPCLFRGVDVFGGA